ncbi:cystathionine beta-lyase / cystathionine gamma-lyase [Lactococcus lactis subsp. lactis IO-1]|nr:cystathionine beta-lyase / cystathionine gamma-lyase [Lactococcus lactis subsp. lactis IO-1]
MTTCSLLSNDKFFIRINVKLKWNFSFSILWHLNFLSYIYSGKKFGAQPLRGCTMRGTKATLFESPPGKPLIVASIAGVMTPAKKHKI